MDIVYHIGAQGADDERLLGSLLKNRAILAGAGVLVPDPDRYRPLLRGAPAARRALPGGDELRTSLLDAAGAAAIRRIVLSDPSLLGAPGRALDRQMLYPEAEAAARRLSRIFPGDGCGFFLGLRNPATFLPALCAAMPAEEAARVLSGSDPRRLRWSDLVRRIRAADPGARITVWCSEDAPLIWPELMRAIADVGPEIRLKGSDDLLAAIMTPTGLRRLRDYLAAHAPPDAARRRRIVSAFLDKYAIAAAIEEAIDIPGWTAELVDELTRGYEEDLAEIAKIGAVTLLSASDAA